METYLTIEGLAVHLKLAEQTIRRWVLNREIPFRKIKKVIRFRLSEIEKWIDEGCVYVTSDTNEANENDLFDENEAAESIGDLETDEAELAVEEEIIPENS